MLEIAFITSSALLLYSIFPQYQTTAFTLWPFLFICCWLKWFCKAHLNIAFTFDLFRFIPHTKVFSDSIRALKIHRAILLSLPIFASSFFLFYLPSIPFWLPIWSLLAITQIPFRKNKKPPPDYSWKFPTEISLPVDPKYPLLRRTNGFTGEKRFDLQRGEKPHLIFVFLESFRAKNVGCLGGEPAVTPHFDLLSEKGILFTQFYANGLQTYRAMIASFFGVPAHLKTMSLEPFCHIPMIGLPQILKENGYETAIFQASPSTFDWSYPFLHKAGFETILGSEHIPSAKKTSWGITDEALFQSAAGWLEGQKKPSFLSLFTISNHHPWESPIKFPVPPDLSEPYQRYLQTFAYTDRCLGAFIDRLKKTKILEKSIVFILGDHGQEMGERNGTIAIHNNLYQENIHIPLLILSDKKTVIKDPASQVDLLPTALDLLNIQAVHHGVGRSLLRTGSGAVFASMPRKEPLMACIKNNQKLILGQKEEFFDLNLDPEEKMSLTVSKEMKRETCSFFHSLDKIFRGLFFAPASMPPTSAILKLSQFATTDFKIDKERAFKLHECNLSNSPFFSDADLKWIGTNCPNLAILDLSYCPSISERGLASLLNRCSSLRSLSIEGHQEITEIPFKKKGALEALNVNKCPQIQGDAFVRIAKYCPHLIYLGASFEGVKDTHLTTLANRLREIQYLCLENGTSIRNEAFNHLLLANPKISILILENFPKLERINLKQHQWLHTLKFSHCPNLTDESLETLEGLQIRDLALVSCPLITSKGLKKINQDCKVYIDDCPGIDTIDLFRN